MQLICEAYYLMKRASDSMPMSCTKLSRMERRRPGQLPHRDHRDIFKKVDEETGKPLVELVLDTAGQKGTGKWTSQSALDLGVSRPDDRRGRLRPVHLRAQGRTRRGQQGAHRSQARLQGDKKAFIERSATRSMRPRSARMPRASSSWPPPAREYNWNLNYGEIAMIWRGGCIIRARFLNRIKEAYDREPKLANLLLDPYFKDIIDRNQANWRRSWRRRHRAGVPVPCVSPRPCRTTTATARAVAGQPAAGPARLLRRPHLRARRQGRRFPGLGAGAMTLGLGRTTLAAATQKPSAPLPTGEAIAAAAAPLGPPGNNIFFEKQLKRMRFDLYHHPPIDILNKGFRPVGGRPADFTLMHHDGRKHYFYIERRLTRRDARFFQATRYSSVTLRRPTSSRGRSTSPSCSCGPAPGRRATSGPRSPQAWRRVRDGLYRPEPSSFPGPGRRDQPRHVRVETVGLQPDLIAQRRRLGRLVDRRHLQLPRSAPAASRWPNLDGLHRQHENMAPPAWPWRAPRTLRRGRITGRSSSARRPATSRACGAAIPRAASSPAIFSIAKGVGYLLLNVSIRDRGRGTWIVESDRMDRFDFDKLRQFGSGGCVEVVRDPGQPLASGRPARRRAHVRRGRLGRPRAHRPPRDARRPHRLAEGAAIARLIVSRPVIDGGGRWETRSSAGACR
jgi:hypothetical protein